MASERKPTPAPSEARRPSVLRLVTMRLVRAPAVAPLARNAVKRTPAAKG